MNKDNISGALFLILPFVMIAALYPAGSLDFGQMIFLIIFCWSFGIYAIYRGNKKEKEKQREIDRINQIEKDKKKRKIEAEKLAKEKVEKQKIMKQELAFSQKNILKELDKDGNGIVDDIEDNDEFKMLLKKYEKQIVEIDRNHVKEFIKVSSYLKTKKKNIQQIFNSIKDTSHKQELEEYVGILKNEIHSYKLILFNALNMIVALVENDMITFYEIHDSFDKLNMFNSNWENEVSQKLSNIGDGLNNLMYSINEMGQNIIQEIGDLNYATAESNRMLTDKLEEVDSSIKVNNLLTGIQTYQIYKVNSNTKSLRN